MLASGAHWARKFDPAHDADVLAMLDERIRPGRAGRGGQTSQASPATGSPTTGSPTNGSPTTGSPTTDSVAVL
jgi:hypothetical protein